MRARPAQGTAVPEGPVAAPGFGWTPDGQSLAMAELHVGTSGWSYPSWRGDFVPDTVSTQDQLQFLARKFTSLEVNATFYALQSPDSFRRWAAAVPPKVSLAVKGSRYITHLKRLHDVDQAMANFWASGPLELGSHLGPVLWQLPPSLTFDEGRMEAFLSLLPRTTSSAATLARAHDDRVREPSTRPHGTRPIRHAVEPRHDSFDTPAAQAVLRRHDVATVLTDGAGLLRLDADTAAFRYVRLHGRPVLYRSGYGDAALSEWTERVGGWLDGGQDVHVYFDNDAEGRAPYDAVRLLELLGVRPEQD